MNTLQTKRGLFIVLDGMDGSGKSTVFKYLFQRLQQLGLNAIGTREIGGTPYGEQIRSISLIADQPLDPMARMLGFLASRMQHVKHVIQPAIAAGTSVVCDRFSDSTYVYQGVVDGLLPQYLELMSTKALSEIAMRPDITVFLTVDPDRAFERGEARGQLDNDLYKKKRDFAHKVAAGYRHIIEGLSPEQRRNIFLVDTNGDLQSVQLQLDRVADHIIKGYHVQ